MAAALLVPLAGCSTGTGAGDADTLTVLAAASLTDVYAELATEFEAEHPGVDVELSFGSSTELAEQAADGAPGDVLATADPISMRVATDADATATEPVVFGTNSMVLVVPAGNPAGIAGLDDLAGSTWVRCADEVPCGRVALALVEQNGLSSEPASLEQDVRSALEKVTSGEADAGLVYATDAASAGDAVEVVPVPGAGRAATSYLLAVLDGAQAPGLAQDWVDLVLSEAGRTVLTDAGFGAP
ncbi:molybdate ABC transporter substrate-binding protein [Nocardioides sp. MJB4]|uniref:Molybdate ABC transporter substrate-binding protein n=1 Tax=Nocardioides donggukensis TaxID=2774019 RepID=A0A927K4J6_9ACTN|nr:molybdate ABC transporter substrate-binding protein [Nocardioides donggukensis]